MVSIDEQLSYWASIIEEITGDEAERSILNKYATNLLTKNLPVIFTFRDLAATLNINIETLTDMVYNIESYYSEFEIPKRKGGSRLILAPYSILLQAQKWIYDNILQTDTPHHNATGFVKGLSIIDNARVHLNSECVLKMDIEDFFPSIPRQRVYYIFKRLGYTQKIAWNLATLCCYGGFLPQGAPTSPVISNLISHKLDRRLSGLAAKFKLTYTRYADDITFSGVNLPSIIINYITEIVEDQGFRVNKKKTQLLIGKRQKIVTGISISSEKMTIPRIKKREVRKHIYHILSKGLLEHQNVIANDDPIFLERLLGYLYFWLSIEPTNPYVIESISKLKNYSKELDYSLSKYKDIFFIDDISHSQSMHYQGEITSQISTDDN